MQFSRYVRRIVSDPQSNCKNASVYVTTKFFFQFYKFLFVIVVWSVEVYVNLELVYVKLGYEGMYLLFIIKTIIIILYAYVNHNVSYTQFYTFHTLNANLFSKRSELITSELSFANLLGIILLLVGELF